MDDFDKNMIAEFISEYWQHFVGFLEERGLSEADANEILGKLED